MTNYPINDPLFRVEVLAKTERPNLVSYLAMHQDYCENDTFSDLPKLSNASDHSLGKWLVNKCVKYGHWGVLEHPSITFNVIGFPHSVMVQSRTHRVGISFDVQSQRYTGKRVESLAEKMKETPYMDTNNISLFMENVFYFRPIGFYTDRDGEKYEYSELKRFRDMQLVKECVSHYYRNRTGNNAYAPEHARDLLPQNIRQDFVVTFNARSLLHFCDLRIPKDSQLEIQTMALMMFKKFKEWMPEVAEFYEQKRLGKNKLAP